MLNCKFALFVWARYYQDNMIRWAHVGSWWKCGRGYVNIGPTSVHRNKARFWITSDVSIYLTSLNVSHFRNSNAYNSVIYERKHKVWVFIFLVKTTMLYQNYLCFNFFFFFFFFFAFCIFTACLVNWSMTVYCIK